MPSGSPGAIKNIASASVDRQQSIGQTEAIPSIVELMRSPNEALSTLAAFTLATLTHNHRVNEEIAAECGALPRTIELLRTGTGQLQEAATALLKSLVANDSNGAAAVQHGAMQPLVAILHDGVPSCRELAIWALNSICMLPECEAAAESAGVVPALVQLLTNAPVAMKEAQIHRNPDPTPRE